MDKRSEDCALTPYGDYNKAKQLFMVCKLGDVVGQYPISKVLALFKRDGLIGAYVEWVVSFAPLSEINAPDLLAEYFNEHPHNIYNPAGASQRRQQLLVVQSIRQSDTDADAESMLISSLQLKQMIPQALGSLCYLPQASIGPRGHKTSFDLHLHPIGNDPCALEHLDDK